MKSIEKNTYFQNRSDRSVCVWWGGEGGGVVGVIFMMKKVDSLDRMKPEHLPNSRFNSYCGKCIIIELATGFQENC